MTKLIPPVGFPVANWTPRSTPPKSPMSGDHCQLIPLDITRHADDLFQAFKQNVDDSNWTYLPYGPFVTIDEFRKWLNTSCRDNDPLFFSVIDHSTKAAVGLASYLRIEPSIGVIEVGHIHFSPLVQRTVVSTEAMYLMMCRVFEELGYRRYEWKCDALNAPSRSAALRLGFQFEGIFRQATMYKGRNRDTAWYSVIDTDWPATKKALSRWLSANNFDDNGMQIRSLSELQRCSAGD